MPLAQLRSMYLLRYTMLELAFRALFAAIQGYCDTKRRSKTRRLQPKPGCRLTASSQRPPE